MNYKVSEAQVTWRPPPHSLCSLLRTVFQLITSSLPFLKNKTWCKNVTKASLQVSTTWFVINNIYNKIFLLTTATECDELSVLQSCTNEKVCQTIVCDPFVLEKESSAEFRLSGDVHFKDLKQIAAVRSDIKDKYYSVHWNVSVTDMFSLCRILTFLSALLETVARLYSEVQYMSIMTKKNMCWILTNSRYVEVWQKQRFFFPHVPCFLCLLTSEFFFFKQGELSEGGLSNNNEHVSKWVISVC